MVLTSQDDCGPNTQPFAFAVVNRERLSYPSVMGIKNVILYMGVTRKETKQPQQQRFGTQGLSLTALSNFFQTVLLALRCRGGLWFICIKNHHPNAAGVLPLSNIDTLVTSFTGLSLCLSWCWEWEFQVCSPLKKTQWNMHILKLVVLLWSLCPRLHSSCFVHKLYRGTVPPQWKYIYQNHDSMNPTQ